MLLDRGSVIEDLALNIRWIRDNPSHQFPGWGNTVSAMCDAMQLLKEQEHKDKMFHALEDDWKRLKGLLKEQEDTINELQNAYGYLQKQFFEAQDKLLKEQEAVEPEIERSGSGVTWWNVCGNCKTAINPNDKYCHECGRSVKWE